MNVRIPVALRDRLDHVRGNQSRDQYITRLLDEALAPAALYTTPHRDNAVHTHQRGRPLRTEFKDGKAVRYYECPDCGLEAAL